jgi:hypothetical protein
MSVLAVDPAAPWYLKAAAETILVLHVGGGGVGMASGAVALTARKGGRVHGWAGKAFFVSMLTMSAIGTTVAPFIPPLSDEWPNVIAGIMTFYLVLSSWVAIRRQNGAIGRFEIGGLAAALVVCAAGIFFIHKAMASPTGTIGDTPPQAFYVFLLVGGIAAASDLKVILRRGVSGPARLARHLWRMCVALTIAAGSFLLGQAQVLPAFLRNSPLVFALVFAPLILMVFWLVRVRLKRRLASADPGDVIARYGPQGGRRTRPSCLRPEGRTRRVSNLRECKSDAR